MNWDHILKEVKDFLFPRMGLSLRERTLYYHLLLHTRLAGKDPGIFPVLPLSNALGIAERSAREGMRILHDKGCIRIEESSRRGHLVHVLLPSEIDGLIPKPEGAQPIDLETIDSGPDRSYVDALLGREAGRCFYCLRKVSRETCELDYVNPMVTESDPSYRNIVASCHECSTQKQGIAAEDFVRHLYRRGFLSPTELEERLEALGKLRTRATLPNSDR